MKIKKLHIENYKSIRNIQLENPKPFSVFVGPNGAGKSNIFEAIEFFGMLMKFINPDIANVFGGAKSIFPYTNSSKENTNSKFTLITESGVEQEVNYFQDEFAKIPRATVFTNYDSNPAFYHIYLNQKNEFLADSITFPYFSYRVFLKSPEIKKTNVNDDSVLSSDASNIEKVLNRILQDETKKVEIIEWLQVLIPEFQNIQIETSKLSGDVNYVIFEKHTQKPFPKHLISDGTKNILALLTAVYQSDEPQFLCIEEPENGLHPHVIENLVSFFRNACEEKGHYIWLNTHSQTLVRQLTVDEIIVVEKKQGATTARQFQGEDLFGMKMDEAWLTNALGGGLP